MAKTGDRQPPARRWRLVCKHSDGMEFRGLLSDAEFAQLQELLFGQVRLPLSDQPKG